MPKKPIVKKPAEKKKCWACPADDNMHFMKDFYISRNPMHSDGKLPWCKKCIQRLSVDESGKIDEDKLKSVLRQLDKPYYKDVIQSAIEQFKKEHIEIPEEDIKYCGKEIVGIYFKNLNSLKQLTFKTYSDSEREGFVKKPGVIAANLKLNESVIQKDKDKHVIDVGDFVVTDTIKDLFGDGYTTQEYKKMYDKFEKLKINYPLQTSIHQETLATYVRFKVKEEDATARGDVDEAKKWYDAAQNAAEKGKLTPKQLSKADLEGGVNSLSEISKAVEQATDVIKILPQFKYRPNDAVDFVLWCYINYERRLNGQPLVDYSEIYSFYDKRKLEYIEQNGDPYGIFTNDPTEKNRDTVKKFITLPDDYDELAGEKSEN